MKSKRTYRGRTYKRALRFEGLEQRVLLAIDLDDSLAEAVLLGSVTTSAKTVSAAISPDTDVDMYRFTVTAGQVVDFDIDTALNGPGGLGSYLRLFNSSGQQLAVNNDGMAPGENVVGYDSYLRHTFATSGTYYLGVSNANNRSYSPLTGDWDTSGGSNTTGDYSLTVQALPVDTNDALSEAPSLGAVSTTPKTVSETIWPDIDVDMYRFTASAGQVVAFDIDTALNGPGGLGSYLRLFNSSGVQLAFNNDGAAPGETAGYDAYLRYNFASSGTYYLGVSNANNISYSPLTGNGDTAGGLDSIGDYQLTVQVDATAQGDPDDALGEAALLGALSTTPKVLSATISPDIDVDMYRFSVTAGQVVDFDIDTALNGPGGLGSYLRLFNSAGTQLAFNNDAMAPGENVIGYDAYLRHTFASGGTYYLGVSNANNTAYSAITGNGDTAGGLNATGDYQLTLQVLPVDTNDSLAEAPSLGAVSTTPKTVSETISPDIDVDIYRFTVSAGQLVGFDIDTATNGAPGLGSYLRLFNSSGVQLAFNNDQRAPDENLTGFDSYLQYRFPTTGTFYIGVSNGNNILYNPVSGAGDTAGGYYSVGDYDLVVQAIPVSGSLAQAVATSDTSRTAAEELLPSRGRTDRSWELAFRSAAARFYLTELVAARELSGSQRAKLSTDAVDDYFAEFGIPSAMKRSPGEFDIPDFTTE